MTNHKDLKTLKLYDFRINETGKPDYVAAKSYAEAEEIIAAKYPWPTRISSIKELGSVLLK